MSTRSPIASGQACGGIGQRLLQQTLYIGFVAAIALALWLAFGSSGCPVRRLCVSFWSCSNRKSRVETVDNPDAEILSEQLRLFELRQSAT